MADRIIQTETLTAIADAIRAKTGGSETMTPAQMATQIAAIQTKETQSWHQDSEAVRSYLANVEYDPSDYTDTEITDYAPSAAAPNTNSKPAGLTVDGITFYNEVPNAETPFATANKAGTLTPLDQVRWIKSQTTNCRDLGGWACDGGKVRYGLLYRAGNLVAADEDLFINQLGIRRELDLTADGTPAYPGKMRFSGFSSYAMYSLANTEAWRFNLGTVFDSVQYGEPLIFHCSMGADRTGTLACVLEGLLGMSQSDVDKDYELTSFYYPYRARNGNYQGGTADWAHLMAAITALSGSTFRDKCVTFALSLGFTVSEINTFRKAMIDGTPADITGPTFAVTNSLSNCASSNIAGSIGINERYTATITANSGYTLDGASVAVSMGGTDITEAVYSSGVISIPAVTGAIAISVSATKEQTMVELFDPSAATLNVRFSSTGATSSRDGNFVTALIEIPEGMRMNTSEPWRIHIRDTSDSTKFRATAAQESVLYCKADGTVMNSNYGRLTLTATTQTSPNVLKVQESDGGVYIDINKTADGNYIPATYFDVSQVAYIRLCLMFSSSALTSTDQLANVSIKADKIIA